MARGAPISWIASLGASCRRLSLRCVPSIAARTPAPSAVSITAAGAGTASARAWVNWPGPSATVWPPDVKATAPAAPMLATPFSPPSTQRTKAPPRATTVAPGISTSNLEPSVAKALPTTARRLPRTNRTVTTRRPRSSSCAWWTISIRLCSPSVNRLPLWRRALVLDWPWVSMASLAWRLSLTVGWKGPSGSGWSRLTLPWTEVIAPIPPAAGSGPAAKAGGAAAVRITASTAPPPRAALELRAERDGVDVADVLEDVDVAVVPRVGILQRQREVLGQVPAQGDRGGVDIITAAGDAVRRKGVGVRVVLVDPVEGERQLPVQHRRHFQPRRDVIALVVPVRVVGRVRRAGDGGMPAARHVRVEDEARPHPSLVLREGEVLRDARQPVLAAPGRVQEEPAVAEVLVHVPELKLRVGGRGLGDGDHAEPRVRVQVGRLADQRVVVNVGGADAHAPELVLGVGGRLQVLDVEAGQLGLEGLVDGEVEAGDEAVHPNRLVIQRARQHRAPIRLPGDARAGGGRGAARQQHDVGVVLGAGRGVDLPPRRRAGLRRLDLGQQLLRRPAMLRVGLGGDRRLQCLPGLGERPAAQVGDARVVLRRRRQVRAQGYGFFEPYRRGVVLAQLVVDEPEVIVDERVLRLRLLRREQALLGRLEVLARVLDDAQPQPGLARGGVHLQHPPEDRLGFRDALAPQQRLAEKGAGLRVVRLGLERGPEVPLRLLVTAPAELHRASGVAQLEELGAALRRRLPRRTHEFQQGPQEQADQARARPDAPGRAGRSMAEDQNHAHLVGSAPAELRGRDQETERWPLPPLHAGGQSGWTPEARRGALWQ